MPFTVFHWGFPYIFGELFFKQDKRKARIQLVTLFGATISDTEGFLHVIGFNQIQLHGPLHSILGCLLIGVILLLGAELSHQRYKDEVVTEDDFIPRYFKWKLTRNERIIYILSPLIFQLALDVWIYSDIELFWPFLLSQNILASPSSSLFITNIATVTLFVTLIWFIINFLRSLVKHMNIGGFEPQ